MAGRAQFFEILTAFSVAAAGAIAAGFAAAELGVHALPCRPGLLLIAATLQFLQQGGEDGGISRGRLGALLALPCARKKQAGQSLVAGVGKDLVRPNGEVGGIGAQITSRCFDQDVLDPAGELFGLGSRNQQQPGAATGEYGHLLDRPWRRETPEDREFLLGEIGNLPAPAEKVDRPGNIEEVVLDARSVEKQESQRRRVAKKWGEIRPGWRWQSGR